jgi:hypothetical protein
VVEDVMATMAARSAKTRQLELMHKLSIFRMRLSTKTHGLQRRQLSAVEAGQIQQQQQTLWIQTISMSSCTVVPASCRNFAGVATLNFI